MTSSRSPSPLHDISSVQALQASPLPCKGISLSPSDAGASKVWQKLVTQEGKFYYHDTVNNHTQWTPPPGLRSV